MVGHVLKRILLVLSGYLVGLIAGLLAVVGIYAALSYLPNAPGHFAAMGVTPIAVLLVPPLGAFVYLLAIVATSGQSLTFALISETFALRQFWLHLLSGGLAATSGYALVTPDPGLLLSNVDLGIIAASGLAGGFVYWLIAGRDAGFRRAAPAVPAH